MDVPQRILVLDVSGYIDQHLVQALGQQGRQVLATVRRIGRLEEQRLSNVSCHKVSLSWSENLIPLLTGADTAYCLVHGMGEGGNFIAHERQMAMNVCDALCNMPVEQLIFLSSLQALRHGQSDRLRARQITVGALRGSGAPMTELHVDIIVGAGPVAFEVTHDMAYNLPILTPPRWVCSRTTPTALENLMYYLAVLSDHPTQHHHALEAAGPQVLSYQEQLEHPMVASGKHRLFIPIPFPIRWILVWLLDVITSVLPTVVKALIQGLKHDLLANDTELHVLIPQKPAAFDDAVYNTLKKEEKLVNSSDWGHNAQASTRQRPEYGYLAKQAGLSVETSVNTKTL